MVLRVTRHDEIHAGAGRVADRLNTVGER